MMKLFVICLVFVMSGSLTAQNKYAVTYEERSINGELTKLAEQLPPEARSRMASYEHVIRTFQLTHTGNISRYEFVSARYDSAYAGQQYPSSTSTVYYKDMSKERAEILQFSNQRGCNQTDHLEAQEYDIVDSTKMYRSLLIQKAVHRDNPNVVVWFAPRIPVSDGPGSIAGFPGLVVEHTTTAYQTIMVGIEELVDTVLSIDRPDCPIAKPVEKQDK